MKFVFRRIIIFLALAFCVCASAAGKENYTALAKEHPFEYFFPSSNFTKTFSSIDDAELYINTATRKFDQSSYKKRAKGLGARLKGPAIKNAPVTVVCMMFAIDKKMNRIDLTTKNTNDLPDALRQAISATLVFCVFSNDRAASLSNYYLAQGYKYTSSSNMQSFTISGNRYDAEYPVGWNIDKAFKYLRKEID